MAKRNRAIRAAYLNRYPTSWETHRRIKRRKQMAKWNCLIGIVNSDRHLAHRKANRGAKDRREQVAERNCLSITIDPNRYIASRNCTGDATPLPRWTNRRRQDRREERRRRPTQPRSCSMVEWIADNPDWYLTHWKGEWGQRRGERRNKDLIYKW